MLRCLFYNTKFVLRDMIRVVIFQLGNEEIEEEKFIIVRGGCAGSFEYTSAY